MKIKLENNTYNLPESWDKITLRQFKNILLIDDKQDELQYKIAILSELLQCTIEELEVVSLNSLNSIWNRVSIFLEKRPTEKLDKTILLNGKEFYFDNQLDKNTNYGMFVDISNFMKEKNFWEVSEKVLAIYIRPVVQKKKDFRKWLGWKKDKYPDLVQVQKYDSSKLDEHAELILDCPMSYIFPVSFFFWNLSTALKQNIPPSSPVQMNQPVKMNP